MATVSAAQAKQDPPLGKLNFDRWAAFLGFVLLVLTIVFFNLSLDGEIQAIDSKIDSVRIELETDIENLRKELKADIAAVHSELKADIQRLEVDVAAVRTELQADIQRLDDRIFAIVAPAPPETETESAATDSAGS